MESESKLSSRKFWLSLMMILLGSAMFSLPTFLGAEAILSGAQYISFMLGILSIYSTANIAERHVHAKSSSHVAKPATNKPQFLDGQDLRGLLLK